MEKIRLQKYLAQCGVASRRKSELLITAGRVRVNGKVVSELGSQIDPISDKVDVDGQRISSEVQGLILLNKPKNVITTCEDTHDRQTVVDFLPKEYQSYFPVGRLDIDTTGLVILTNDGELADYLTHPRYEIKRTYHALVTGKVSPDLVARAKKGVKLEDGFANADLKILGFSGSHSNVQVTLHIGKKHIVKRLLAELGHPVLELCRTEHGPIKLGQLGSGKIKIFSEQEYRRIRRQILSEGISE